MRTLYIDCTNGLCGDMFVSGFTDLGAATDEKLRERLREIIERRCGHSHGHEHFHRSYADIKKILAEAPISDAARATAERIYAIIAEAEAEVHGGTVQDVHFHEVGRENAIFNVLAAAAMLDDICPDRIVCSRIHDGCGTIECSHGTIPVPVPAVAAMMKKCDYDFRTDAIEEELVTPSGLAILMGMGSVSGARPQGNIIAKGLGFGGRDTGRGGMEIYLISEE